MLNCVNSDFKYLLPWLVLLSFSSTVMQPERAIAQTTHCLIESSLATGESGHPPVVKVYRGSGLNISFIPLFQKLKKVWLDDPSQVTVDFDAPLEKGASVVHLKRINPLHFPQLPKSDRTLLTVITINSQGQQFRYQFQLTYGNQGTPPCYGISIIPDPVQTTSVAYLPLELESNLMRGLAIAKRRGLISSKQGNLVLERRVKQYISLRRQGVEERFALSRAKVSQTFLDRLLELSDRAVNEQPIQEETICDGDEMEWLECLFVE